MPLTRITSPLITVLSTYPLTGSLNGTASYAVTASYAMNGGSGGGGGAVQTGSIANQTVLYNVTTSQDNVISGLNLTGNKWGVTVVEEWNSASIAGDPYYNSCSLLMHFSGSNSSTTFIDNSPNNFTVTPNNGAFISTAQNKFGGSSGFFDGTDDYLSITDNSVFDFGSGDFTIEYWEYRTVSTLYKPVISRNNNGYPPFMLGWSESGNVNFFISTNGSSWDVASAVSMGTLTTNVWTHYAVTRQGNTFRTFQNGTQISTFTSTATLPAGSGTLQIGRYSSVYYYQGYLDELRISKGVARYTGSFTTSSNEFYNNLNVTQLQTKYIGLVGGLNDSNVDYGVEKLSDSSLKIRKMTATGQPLSGSGSTLSASVDRVYVNVLDYTNVMVTSSYALTSSYINIATNAISSSYANTASVSISSSFSTTSSYNLNSISSSYSLTASFASNVGSSLTTGSTYPITSSWANNATTATSANTANSATSASYALTASFALNASGGGGGSGTVTGSVNYISKFTSVSAVGNSVIYETGSNIGIGTTSPNSKLNINSSGSLVSGSVVFSVEGTQGSLFSVDDNLSGSLMSVNDVSGLPILEVFSDDRLVVGTYNSNALVVTGSRVGIGTNSPIAKLQVSGNISGSSFTSSVSNGVGFLGTSSFSTTSSFSITSSYALNALTASFALNASGGGGGSGTVTGSTNYISKFTSGTSVGNSVIYETGSNIGIGTTVPNSKLNINSSGSLVSGSVVFSVEGTQGSLFSVDDNLSGSLMSVNDVSGLPILEVFSDDRLVVGTYNSNSLVVTGSRVGIGTNNPIAKLQVNGNISGSSFTGSVFGTSSWASNTLTASSLVTTNNYTVSTLNVNSSGSTGASTNGSLTISGQNTKGGANYHDFLYITNTVAGGVNPNKFFRQDNTGNLEIINSNYGTNIFTLTDSGSLQLPTAQSANVTQLRNTGAGLKVGNYGLLFDDGNVHLHSTSPGTNIWLNCSGSGMFVVNGQTGASGGMCVGTSIQKGYVTIVGSVSAAITQPYGYLISSGAGTTTGTSPNPYSLTCDNRVMSSEFNVPSDERLKDIKGEISLNKAIDLVTKITPIEFTWKDGVDSGLKAGYSAQQTYKAGFEHLLGVVNRPGLEATTDSDGFINPKDAQFVMNYEQVTPYHSKLIKHLLEKIEILENRISQLENKTN